MWDKFEHQTYHKQRVQFLESNLEVKHFYYLEDLS